MGIFYSVRVEGLSGPFSVSAILPENQINSEVTFFDIGLEPGDVQILEVLLENYGDSEIIVMQEVNTAITNDNGIIDYTQANAERDSTLLHSFSDIATFDEEIVLPARSSKTIQIEIDLPDESFEGVILGGLRYQEKVAEDYVSDVQIENQFAFVLGLRISVGDVENLEPDLQLNDIFPNQRNYRNVLSVNLQNTEAVMISELTIDAKVFMLGHDEPIREVVSDNLRMAPNSNFNFPISWEYQPFEDGNYILEMTVTAVDREWNFRREFTIDNSDELNEIAILEEIEQEINMLFLAIIAGLMGIVLGVIFSNYAKKKSK